MRATVVGGGRAVSQPATDHRQVAQPPHQARHGEGQPGRTHQGGLSGGAGCL